MLPDITTPIMMTMAVIIGLLILNVVIQVANYVRTSCLEHRILKNQVNLYTDLLNFIDQQEPIVEYDYALEGVTPSLEDLIRCDLEEQMSGYDPELHVDATNDAITEILKESMSDGKS